MTTNTDHPNDLVSIVVPRSVAWSLREQTASPELPSGTVSRKLVVNVERREWELLHEALHAGQAGQAGKFVAHSIDGSVPLDDCSTLDDAINAVRFGEWSDVRRIPVADETGETVALVQPLSAEIYAELEKIHWSITTREPERIANDVLGDFEPKFRVVAGESNWKSIVDQAHAAAAVMAAEH